MASVPISCVCVVCVPYLSLIVLTEKLQIEKKNINKINEKYQQQQI